MRVCAGEGCASASEAEEESRCRSERCAGERGRVLRLGGVRRREACACAGFAPVLACTRCAVRLAAVMADLRVDARVALLVERGDLRGALELLEQARREALVAEDVVRLERVLEVIGRSDA